jgi:hypothetical protein
VLRTALAATASTIGLVATGAVLAPASADPPTKVGWWTQGGGPSTPAPDTTPGGMRVAVGPQAGVVSYGALEYSVPSDATGTLELTITQSTPAPPQPPGGAVTFTPLGNIAACPTKTDSWKAGDHQDIATGPAYDCSTFHFAGAPSADGKTMTFLLDGAADQTPGTMSLAIVPVQTTAVYTAGTDTGTDTTPPYYVDFDKPTASSLQLDTSATVTPPATYTPPPSSGGSTGSGAGTTGGSTGGTTVPSVPSSGTGTVSTDTTSGQTPVVAGQQPAQNYAAPAANISPAAPSDHHRDLLLVLLILVLFGILYTQNMSGRAPRALAGPRAAEAAAAAAAAGTTASAAALPVTMAGFLPSRGLGRFAKPRTGSARPLI